MLKNKISVNSVKSLCFERRLFFFDHKIFYFCIDVPIYSKTSLS